MRLVEWPRGTGVRITALTTIFVLAIVVLLGLFVYSLVDDALRERVRARIVEEFEGVIAVHDPNRPERIIAAIDTRTRDGTVRRFAYHLTRSDGSHVAGDAWLDAATVGWHWQRLDDKSDQAVTDGHVMVYTRRLDAHLVLSIARDAHWIADVEEELSEMLLRALALAVAGSLLVSLLITRMIARRIELVTTTARVVMDGNLSQRIATTGAGDDFDRLAKTLNDMLDRIRTLMDGLSQVTNDIAHDLRTPLGRLRQRIEQVRDDTSLAEQHADTLDQAVAEADGLLATFTAMLRIAQIDSGARRSGFKAADLSNIAGTVCEAYALNAEETGHAIVPAIDPGVSLNGDRDLLTQLFANLIENALTHTPSGTRIEVEVRQSSAGISVAVADNGPGVPAGEIDKIFERFYRAEPSRTTPGTGLGLSLVVAIAKLHGGTIAATDNAPGLRISIFFPADPLA